MVSAGEDDVLVSGHLSQSDVVRMAQGNGCGLLALHRLAGVEERVGRGEGVLGRGEVQSRDERQQTTKGDQ